MVVPRDLATDLSLGAIVDVKADATEFYCNTQIKAFELTPVSTEGDAPTGTVINATDLNNGVGSNYTARDISNQPSLNRDVIATLARDPLAISNGPNNLSVAGVNPPFGGQAALPSLEALKDRAGIWDYQFYFQEPGVAEAEVEADVERSFRLIFRASDAADEFDILAGFDTVRERGGILAGYPADAARSVMLSAEELDVYVQEFQRTGFRGPFNWYRNDRTSWEWGEETKGQTIDCPALMVTAGKDPVLTPARSEGMESVVPNLVRGHIEECAHWTQQERPDELNAILIDWLNSL